MIVAAEQEEVTTRLSDPEKNTRFHDSSMTIEFLLEYLESKVELML
jgi:hypothetical protein